MARKYRMGEAEHEGKTLTCSRGSMWPPIEVGYYGGVQEARAEVTNARYHAITIWQQACGLSQMDPGKCPTCPYVLVDGKRFVEKRNTIHSTRASRIAEQRKKHFDRKVD